MGNNKSKTALNSGDPQVQILNELAIHEEYHADHEFKLNIILALVGLQLAVMFYQLYKLHTKRQAMKAARSIANMQNPA